MPDRQISLGDRQRLLEALLRVRSLHEVAHRDRCVAELEARLGRPLQVARYAEAQHDLWSLLGGALTRSGGLRTFVRVVYDLHGEDHAVREVERAVEELERGVLVAPADRDALHEILGGAGPDALVAAAEAAGRRARAVADVAGDIPELVRRLETAPLTAEGVPALLAFADRLAHLTGGDQALALHRWVDVVSGGFGLTQAGVRELCIASRRALAGEPAEPPAGLADPGPQDGGGPVEAVIVHVPPILPLRVSDGDEAAPAERRPIRGGLPIRNPDFTGREAMLDQLNAELVSKSKVSVLPQTLHGLGGVGKTQLAIEFVYRYADQYDLTWWIPAEQPSAVLSSLARLAVHLEVPESDDLQQTAAAVLDSLATTALRWLLVYDNADRPEELARFVPPSGGHVIITSRNQEWGRIGNAVEVDVFERGESVALIQKRGEGISDLDADLLADKLGDLPLALEQAATWQSATGMPVSEYLQLFDEHVRELLSEGRPASYPTTVAAFVGLAVERLWEYAPATAQLFEMFAFLGAEPISSNLLRAGREAPLSEPLRTTLRQPIEMSRAIRELRRVGLARVEPNGQQIQVHRLMKLVLRDGLDAEHRERSRSNAQWLLAYANPGDPDEQQAWAMHAEIGPHLGPAGLIEAGFPEARQVVSDQIRYLYLIGDYENSRLLAEDALLVWREGAGEGIGPEGGLTLLATRHLGNALRALGESKRGRELTQEAYDGLRRSAQFGENHEYTLITANGVALDLRIQGDYRAALEVDLENLRRHRQVFGEEDLYTLRVRRNVAVNLRMLGDLDQAYEIDTDLVRQWSRTMGPSQIQTLACQANVARDLLAMGRHQEAFDLLAGVVPELRAELGGRHSEVLLAARSQAIAMLRLGQFASALVHAREAYGGALSRLGANHEHTLAAAMTLANALRAAGETAEARKLAEDAVDRYHRDFGADHPFTLAAEVNLGLLLRALGEVERAQALDERAELGFREALGADHTYTLRTASNLANDLALLGDAPLARELSERTYAELVRQRGAEHPHTLACAGNVAFDRMATGDPESGRELLAATLATMALVLGEDHPDTLDRARGRRAECDLEPSPT